jgi:hypothetical protein
MVQTSSTLLTAAVITLGTASTLAAPVIKGNKVNPADSHRLQNVNKLPVNNRLRPFPINDFPINDFPVNNIPVNNNFQPYFPFNDFPINNIPVNNFQPYPPVNNFQPYPPVNDFPINNIPVNKLPVRKPVSFIPMKQNNKVMAREVEFDDLVAREVPFVSKIPVTNFPQPPVFQPHLPGMGHGPVVHYGTKVAREVKPRPVEGVSKIPIIKPINRIPVDVPPSMPYFNDPKVSHGSWSPFRGVSTVPVKPVNHVPTNLLNNDVPPYYNNPKDFSGSQSPIRKEPFHPFEGYQFTKGPDGRPMPQQIARDVESENLVARELKPSSNVPPPIPYFNNPRVFAGATSPFRAGPNTSPIQHIARDVESDNLVAREVKPSSGVSMVKPVNHIPINIFHNNLPVPPISSFNSGPYSPGGPQFFGPRLPEGPHPFGHSLTNIGRELPDDLMERDVESENLVAREVKHFTGVSKIPIYDDHLPVRRPIVPFKPSDLLPTSHGPVREPRRFEPINKTPVRPFEPLNQLPVMGRDILSGGDDLMERDYDDYLYERDYLLDELD